MTTQKKQTNFITLNSINVNAGLVSWYKAELTRFVRVMIKVYEKEIAELYQSNKQQIKEIKYANDDNIGSQARITLNRLNKVYSEYYEKKSKKTSETMIKKLEKILKKSFENNFYSLVSKLTELDESKAIKTIFAQFSPEVLSNKQKFIKAWSVNRKLYSEINDEVKKTIVMNNTELIKTIQQQYHKEISQQVYECVVNGRPYDELTDKIKIAGQKTTRRARLIADDQINKAHSVLYRQELKQLGITKARWIHLGGGKTDRVTHITKSPKGLNNAIFDLREGIYDPSVKRKIFPAELPFCRCVASPIVEI